MSFEHHSPSYPAVIIAGLFALFLSLFSISALAEDPASRLNSLLSNFHSMSANFTQQSTVKGGVKSQAGTMALQRPGKFRWEVTQPNHQIIVADGQNLWVYDVDLEQAARQSLMQDPNSPAILLSGSIEEVENRFMIVDYRQEGNKTFFQLKPKQGQEMVKSVELQFVNQKLSRMAVIDNLGARNIFYFYNVKINPSLSSRLFVFRPPKGVDVIQSR